MRVVVSILAHEKPEIVHDQIANLKRYLPGATVVLHLNQKFDWGDGSRTFFGPTKIKVDFSQQPGVLVNPQRLPTQWGNIHHAHNSNFHFAKSRLDFDYFALHSSSDLFVRPGVAQYIGSVDYGVSLLPPQATWDAPRVAEADPVFQSIMKDCGAAELWTSQVEGTFYRKEVFADMLKIIERHHRYNPCLPYIHEEIYYPTVASAIGGNRGFPYLIREDRVDLPKFEPALVDQIRSVSLPDHFKTRWKIDREVTAQVWEGKHIYALRPVPRSIDDPLRAYIRNLED